jgi:general secretion pathway protein C
MVSRIAAFVIWAAVAACSVFWALRLWSEPLPVPAHTTVVAANSGFNGNLDRVLGTDAVAAAPSTLAVAPAPADPRFKLIGVVAPRSAAASAQGLALIALDDKPARPYRVGAVVEGDMVLQAVHSRGATLGPRGQAAQVDLSLPALPPPATGVPPSVGGLSAPMQPAAALPMRPLPPPAQPVEPQLQPAPLAQEPGSDRDEAAQDSPTARPPPSAGRARPL